MNDDINDSISNNQSVRSGHDLASEDFDGLMQKAYEWKQTHPDGGILTIEGQKFAFACKAFQKWLEE